VFEISGFAVGTVFIKRSWIAFLDTGNPMALQFPHWALERYYEQIPNSAWNETYKRYQFPCPGKTMPDIVFGVGDSFKGVIPGNLIQYYLLDGPRNICLGDIYATKDGDTVLWGKLIIQNFYVVHDYKNRRVGFANKSVK